MALESIQDQSTNGHKEQLDEDQIAMLEQVREDLSDILKEEHDDRFLLRFLRARSFHGEDTKEMIRTHLRWRKHFGVDYLMKEYKPDEFFDKYLKMAVLGFTNAGSIVRMLRMGHSDLKGILLGINSLDIEEFMAYVVTRDRYLMEKNREQTGACEETAIYIGDFEEINVYDLPWKYALSVVIRLVKIFEANFPEHLKAVYLINCPTVMYIVLKVLKPFMSEVTASKINIYAREGYQEVLLKDISPDVLPDFLGGIRCDTKEDKTCSYLETMTDKMPESCYVYNAKRLNVTEPGVIEVKVERRQSLCIDVEVPEADYAIVWEVDIQEYDLGLGLFVRKNSNSDDGLKCIKPVKRHKASFSPYVGMHICENPGKYVLMMDNSYSYFTDKTVLYRLKVKPPLDKKQ